MMQAYFDCFSGISGDMTLGAFIDLGVPFNWIEETVKQLPLDGFCISVSSVHRSGIKASSVKVNIEKNDHHRNFCQIKDLIIQSRLPESVKQRSVMIFDVLAEAESAVHGCPKDHVHFHEVGAVDSIVDIVGTALCIDYLKIDEFYASKIPYTTGYVQAQHGPLPVPAPATLNLLKGVPVFGLEVAAELVTPTGAAIIKTLVSEFGKSPDMVIRNIGYGAGVKEIDSIPNLLRIVLGQTPGIPQQSVVMLETCIDNMNPEFFSHLIELLFDNGALDAYMIPLFMKKNRPGTMLQVICPNAFKNKLARIILTHSTSIGLRHYDIQRYTLHREMVTIESIFGPVKVKKIIDPDGNSRFSPEYEVCRQIASSRKIPIKTVYDAIMNETLK